MVDHPHRKGEKIIKCTVTMVRGNVDNELIPQWKSFAQSARTLVETEDTIRNDPQVIPKTVEDIPQTEREAVVALERKECATRVKQYRTLVYTSLLFL